MARPLTVPGNGVEWHLGPATNPLVLDYRTVDFTFSYNLFGGPIWSDFKVNLANFTPKMSPSGTLTILQPNYRYAYRDYSDDFDHKPASFHISFPQYSVSQGGSQSMSSHSLCC